MTANIQITTITPNAIQNTGIASFKPRTKEGLPEKPACHIQYSYPAEFALINNDSIRAYAIRAYDAAMDTALKDAVRDNKSEFTALSLDNCYVATKREFLLTKTDLSAWADKFALPIIAAAIAAKAGLHAESPKVIAKCKAYRESILALAARGMMQQIEIDSLIKVAGLIAEQPIINAYTDNFVQGIARKQERLLAFLENGSELEDDLDF